MKLLADTASDIFGTIQPPISTIPSDSATAVGSLISLGIKVFLFIAGMALLVYLLLGAYEWIVSGGEKEKLTKAQAKITNAVVGIFVVILVLVVFRVITVDILKIFTAESGFFEFSLPQLGH
jgi:hypothetical protein